MKSKISQYLLLVAMLLAIILIVSLYPTVNSLKISHKAEKTKVVKLAG